MGCFGSKPKPKPDPKPDPKDDEAIKSKEAKLINNLELIA